MTQVDLNPGLGLKFPTVRKCSLSLSVILLHVMWLFYKENVIVAYEQSKVVGTSSDPALALWSFLLQDNKRDLGFHALLVAVVLMGYYDILSKNFLPLLT